MTEQSERVQGFREHIRCGCKTEPDGWQCGGCGQKYHLSLWREALQAVAREAYRLGKMDEAAAIDAAVSAGYAVGLTTLQAHILPDSDKA